MASYDPEVIEDQISDLFSTKETVLLLGLFVSPNWLFFWSENHGDFVQFCSNLHTGFSRLDFSKWQHSIGSWEQMWNLQFCDGLPHISFEHLLQFAVHICGSAIPEKGCSPKIWWGVKNESWLKTFECLLRICWAFGNSLESSYIWFHF